MKCCICGKEIKGFGNNPIGAVNKKGEYIDYKEPNDRCCNECNAKYVLVGRMYHMGLIKDFKPVPEK